MTPGEIRQPYAKRGEVTAGVYAWRPLKGLPPANRRTHDAWRDPPTAGQATLQEEGTPEARRAFGCAPAHPQPCPQGQPLMAMLRPAIRRVVAGEAVWTRFVKHGDRRMIEAAQEALDKLGEERDG